MLSAEDRGRDFRQSKIVQPSGVTCARREIKKDSHRVYSPLFRLAGIKKIDFTSFSLRRQEKLFKKYSCIRVKIEEDRLIERRCKREARGSYFYRFYVNQTT